MTTVFHISDWHARNEDFQRQLDYAIRYQKLGEPELIVITGDMIHNFAPGRSRIQGIDPYEERRQLVHYEILIDAVEATWPGTDIFAVRGNHDWCNYGIKGRVNAFDVLEGQTYNWKGLRVHGFRGVPAYGPWNDGYSEVALQALCDLVPLDTDILITHCPPRGIMDDMYDARCYTCGGMVDTKDGTCHRTHIYNPDIKNPIQTVIPRNLGSDAIERLVKKLPNLKAHFFGHVHEAGGRVEVRDGKIFSNASCTLNTVVL